MKLTERSLAASRIDARPSATPQADTHRRESRLLSIPVVALVAICSGLPLAWMLLQIVTNPTVLVEAKLDSFRLHLLGRTLLYNGSVAVIATLLALPAAIVLGRGVGVWSKLLRFLLPVSLLLPSIVYAYGWSQLLRMLNATPAATGFADVARCVWSLATWLWPIPAAIAGLALHRLDAQVQQQALLDGVLWRVTLRQLLGPLLAGGAIVAVLAVQEFSVYEPTGISVVATEVRMVFETGAFASPDNPITAPMGPGSGAELNSPLDQRARAGAAVAASLPMLVVIGTLATLSFLTVRKHHITDSIDVGPWPASLNATPWATIASMVVILIALIVPIGSLIAALNVRFNPIDVIDEFLPQLSGSLLVAGATGLVMMGAALWGCVKDAGRASWLPLATFLIGGQLLAIALIRIYNHTALSAVYNGPGVLVMAYVGRFGWIALAAAAATWGRPWRELRDLAAVDGAGLFQTARSIVWPLAWPVLGASAVLVAILSLAEVPATVLLQPARPPMMTPLLMTWVHMLHWDAMIKGSLLIVGVVVVLTGVVVGLMSLTRGWRMEDRGCRRSARAILCPLFSIFALTINGCGGSSNKPDEIWCEPGTGPVQLVYPRAIAYDDKDDTFFVIDRLAHINHLDRKGAPLNEWKMPEMQAGKPVGVSIGPDGNIYVPDTHYHRVIVYTPQGEEVRRWGSFGHEPGQFIYPTDIEFDAKGNIFVAEYGDNDRIQVFAPDGKFLYQFGKFGDGDGEFVRPQSLLIDGDTIYITDHANHRINVFKTDGTFVRNMCKRGSGLGELRFPYGMTKDSRGRLIVCEFGNNRVQLIDKETGQGLKTWGLGGHEPGQLAYPCGIAVDKHDRVVAVDAGNNRLQVFEF